MSNMSYCRFHNTNSDLADCQQALENILTGSRDPAEAQLSDWELSAAQSLVTRCFDIVALVAESMCIEIEDFDDKRQEVDDYLASANVDIDNEEDEDDDEVQP